MSIEELDYYLWETLYILKELYDHGKGKAILDDYAPYEITGDYCYEVAREAIEHTFEDTRNYYNEEEDLEINVFFDPIITEFFQLCEQYEAETGIPPETNRFRNAITHAIESGFCFDGYSYGYHVYNDTSRKNGCRIVLLFYCEFCSYYEVPGGLLDVYDAFEYQTSLLKAELGMSKTGKIILLSERERKEAA